MSTSFTTVLNESIDRLRSAAGAALFGLILVVSFVSTVASHSQTNALEGFTLDDARESFLEDIPAEGTADQDEEELREAINELFDALEEAGVQTFIDNWVAATSVFDFGMPTWMATEVSYLIWIPMAIVVLGGLRVVAEEHEQFDTSAFENLLWNFINVVLSIIGIIVAAVVVFIAVLIVTIILGLIPFVGPFIALLLWLTVPIVAGALLFYWLPAIAVDNQGAIEAIKTSYQFARSNIWTTIGLVILYSFLQLLSVIVFFVLLLSAPPAVTATTNLLAGVVLTTLLLAWMATGYDLAKETHEVAAQSPADEAWGSNERLGDNSGASADETWTRDGRDRNAGTDPADDLQGSTADETWDSGTQSDTSDSGETRNSGTSEGDDAWDTGEDDDAADAPR